jgi:hypothetical protein
MYLGMPGWRRLWWSSTATSRPHSGARERGLWLKIGDFIGFLGKNEGKIDSGGWKMDDFGRKMRRAKNDFFWDENWFCCEQVHFLKKKNT